MLKKYLILLKSLIDLFLLDHCLKGPDVIHRYRLPKFHNLNHLKLNLQTCCAWKSLTKWLDVSPKLEHLVFRKVSIRNIYKL